MLFVDDDRRTRRPAGERPIKSLVERAGSVVEILDISRIRHLIDALEDELEAITTDEGFRRRLSDAYYDSRVDYDTVDAILGREEAM